MSETLIALQSFRAGAQSFEPCDRYDEGRVRFHEDEHENERAKRLLRQQRYIGPLTRDTYRSLIRRRPPETVGRGFTVEGLIAMGVLDPDEEAAEEPEKFELGPTDQQYGGCVLRVRKQGNFDRVTALSAEGKLLHAKEFPSVRRAQEFVDSLKPE